MIENNGQHLIYILSAPRSGSTLLSAVLGHHSQIFCPPETWLLLPLTNLGSDDVEWVTPYDWNLIVEAWKALYSPGQIRDARRAFALSIYDSFLEQQEKNIFVDKTPRYYHILVELDQLFPNAVKLWLQRNPLDIIASCKNYWHLGIDELLGRNTLTPYSFDTTISHYLLYTFFEQAGPRSYALRYEDFVLDPWPHLREICRLAGVETEPEMVNYGDDNKNLEPYRSAIMGDKKVLEHKSVHSGSVGNWKKILEIGEIRATLEVLGSMVFHQQGYSDEYSQALSICSMVDGDIVPEGQIGALIEKRDAYVTEILLDENKSSYSTVAVENKGLKKRLFECEEDRVARYTLIEQQGVQLGEAISERNNLSHQVDVLRAHLDASDADRAARLEVISQQGRELGEITLERNNLLLEIEPLRLEVEALKEHLRVSEADRAARLDVINQQGRELGEITLERNNLLLQLGEITLERNNLLLQLGSLKKQVDESEADLAAIRGTVTYKFLRKLGKWKSLNDTAGQ